MLSLDCCPAIYAIGICKLLLDDTKEPPELLDCLEKDFTDLLAGCIRTGYLASHFPPLHQWIMNECLQHTGSEQESGQTRGVTEQQNAKTTKTATCVPSQYT